MHKWHMYTIKIIIKHLTNVNVWESMEKPCSCMQFIKSRIFYCKSRENPYHYYNSRENPYQVLQVTCSASERAMKLKVHMIKSLSPWYQATPKKKITRLLLLALLLVLHTCNNTDGNKLVIFSGSALYYGDNYIVMNESATHSCSKMMPMLYSWATTTRQSLVLTILYICTVTVLMIGFSHTPWQPVSMVRTVLG